MALLAAALGLLLAAAPADDWEPQAPPGPTAWSLAGAGHWSICTRFESRARATLLERDSFHGDDKDADLRRLRRTGQEWITACPGGPSVLVFSAMVALVQPRPLPPYSAPVEAFADFAAELAESRAEIRAMLARAAEESRRRGVAPPPLYHYALAWAAVSLGELDVARRELARAYHTGHVEPWRLELVSGVIALLAGDVDQALQLSRGAVAETRGSLQSSSAFLLALAYERAGAPDHAARILDDHHARLLSGEMLLEQLLPLHERLYLSAFHQETAGNVADAIRYWEVYLDRPEPEEPERQSAQRHLEALRVGKR